MATANGTAKPATHLGRKRYDVLEAIIFTPGGNIKLDIDKVLQRPEAQQIIDEAHEIAASAIAKRKARHAQEAKRREQAAERQERLTRAVELLAQAQTNGRG